MRSGHAREDDDVNHAGAYHVPVGDRRERVLGGNKQQLQLERADAERFELRGGGGG